MHAGNPGIPPDHAKRLGEEKLHTKLQVSKRKRMGGLQIMRCVSQKEQVRRVGRNDMETWQLCGGGGGSSPFFLLQHSVEWQAGEGHSQLGWKRSTAENRLPGSVGNKGTNGLSQYQAASYVPLLSHSFPCKPSGCPPPCVSSWSSMYILRGPFSLTPNVQLLGAWPLAV